MSVCCFSERGISADSGAPCGDELSSELAHHFLNSDYSDYPLDEVCQIIEANAGREALNDWLLYRFRKLEPHGPLMQIPEFRWRSIYTVNFDTLLEQAYAEAADPAQHLRIFYTDKEPPDLAENEVPLFKLHGSLRQAEQRDVPLVLTKRDYGRARKIRRNLYHRLFADGSDWSILYVGFSRRDADFYQVMVDIADSTDSAAEIPWSYAVQPWFDEYEFIRWHQERVTLIQATAQEFFTGLEQVASVSKP